MKDFNEEDYLDSLLKKMDGKVEESDDDKQERLLKEQIKEAVEKTNSMTGEDMIQYEEPENSSELEDHALDPDDKMESSGIKAAETEKQAETKTVTETVTKAEPEKQAEKIEFEPEEDEEVTDSTGMSDISKSIDDLSQEEIERLANLDLDEFLKEVGGESSQEDAGILDFAEAFGSTKAESSEDSQQAAEAAAVMFAASGAAIENAADALAGTTGAIGLAGAAVASSIAGMAESDSQPEGKGKKNKKDKKDKKNNKNTNKKKFNILKFIRNIFFEEIEIPDESEKSTLANSRDDNGSVLGDVYNERGENEATEEQPKKRGLFSKAGKKTKGAEEKETFDEDEEEDEAYELEQKQRKKEAKEKKAAEKAKKAEEAKAKKAEKPKKAKKPPKPKKEKKPKPPVRRQDLIKIRPVPMIFFIMFIAGIVLLVQIGNTAFYYQNSIKEAEFNYELGNYEEAYSYLHGMKDELKESDMELYNQTETIMFIQKQYNSYENYMKMGMGLEAVDSLIKGIARYQQFYHSKAQEYGVQEQYDDIKAKIVEALQKTFAMSENKAISYASLAEEDFVQYYYTIESYGGMIDDRNN